MRLQRATSISRLRGAPDDFGRLDAEERQERRVRRKRRRRRRQSQRQGRRADRSRRRADRLEQDHPRQRRRRPERRRPEQDRPERRPRKSRPAPRETWVDEAQLEPAPGSWDQPEVLDVEWEEVDEPEWMGAARAAQLPARWSPPAKMGRHLRLQAVQGHRAAVIELKPGLFLVAELPEQVARSEFGVASVLAPLVVKAASKAIQHRQQTPKEQRLLYRVLHREQGQEGQGQPLRRLFQRPDGQIQDENGNLIQRIFRPRQAQAQAPQPAAPQLPALQPAQGSGQGSHALLPPPELGWADEVLLEPVGVHRG